MSAAQYTQALIAKPSRVQIESILIDVCHQMKCRYFALTQHADFLDTPRSLRIHNYPDSYADWFDEHRLGVSDPIHRASHKTVAAFMWRDVGQMIALTRRDHEVLTRAHDHGIGEGLTVPAHLPGDTLGSCSFAAKTGSRLDAGALAFAQIIGLFAFEAARGLHAPLRSRPAMTLTDRQRECLLWVARGKTDWEVATILGVSPATVVDHVRSARAEFGAVSRTQLLIRVLYDGWLTFSDVLRRP